MAEAVVERLEVVEVDEGDAQGRPGAPAAGDLTLELELEAAPVQGAGERVGAGLVLQLREQLVALKKEAFNLRFQQATGQIESTARMRSVRKDVARVLTVMNQKAADAAASN